MAIAFIGLGSNLAEPEVQVQLALVELQTLSQSRCVAHSSLYRSSPMLADGDSANDQPDYINAVAALETVLEPALLLAELQHLEALHQRIRRRRWGPRTLDLDVLLVGDKIINHARLIIPHPGLHERSFVLYPLQEIAPDLLIPGHGSLDGLSGKGLPLKELIAQCDDEGLERISDA